MGRTRILCLLQCSFVLPHKARLLHVLSKARQSIARVQPSPLAENPVVIYQLNCANDCWEASINFRRGGDGGAGEERAENDANAIQTALFLLEAFPSKNPLGSTGALFQTETSEQKGCLSDKEEMADTPSCQKPEMMLPGETDSDNEPEDSSGSESESDSEDRLDNDEGLGPPARSTVYTESEKSDDDNTDFRRYGTDESAEEEDSDDDAHDSQQHGQRWYGDGRQSMEPEETEATDGRESSDSDSDSDSETENEMRVPGTSMEAGTLTFSSDVEPESETEQDWRAPDISAVGTLTSSDDGSDAEDESNRPRGNYDDDRINCDADGVRDTEGGKGERDGQEVVTRKRSRGDLQQVRLSKRLIRSVV